MNRVDKTGQNDETASERRDRAGKKKRIQARIIDDVFTDSVEMVKPKFEVDYQAYLDRLWEANPVIYQILNSADDIESAREKLYSYLERAERAIFDLDNDLHILEKATVRECIRVFKSIIGPVNEYRTNFSALKHLWLLAGHGRKKTNLPL